MSGLVESIRKAGFEIVSIDAETKRVQVKNPSPETMSDVRAIAVLHQRISANKRAEIKARKLKD